LTWGKGLVCKIGASERDSFTLIYGGYPQTFVVYTVNKKLSPASL